MTKLEDLLKQSVVEELDLRNNKTITSLNNLEMIEGVADFSDSQIQSLNKLKEIGGHAYFITSKVQSLGKLEKIGGHVNFQNSKVQSLGELESIGRNAWFQDSQVQSLGKLKKIGEYANFQNSQVQSLGKLESIGWSAFFQDSQVQSLGELKKIGENAFFSNSKITSLGNLEYVGGGLYFKNSKIKDFGKLQNSDGSFNNTGLQTIKDLLDSYKINKDEIIDSMFNIVKSIDHSEYISTFQKLIEIATKKSAIDNLKDLVIPILKDTDYIEQNLDNIIKLYQTDYIKTKSNVQDLIELKEKMGGFITQELSKAYLKSENKESKRKVISNYKKLMKEVLGSSKLDNKNIGMLAEIIYLAYKPTGYTVERIKEMIENNKLEDLTHHLKNIKYTKNGYNMKFNLLTSKQDEKYDVQKLQECETGIFTDGNIDQLVKTSLSNKKGNTMPQFFAKILDEMNDNRFNSYKEFADSQKYTPERLESLSEIFKVIPKEEKFYEILSDIIMEKDIQTSADIYLWKKNKKNFSKEERNCKNNIDQILKEIEKGSDVNDLLNNDYMKILDLDLNNKDNKEIYDTLLSIKRSKFLGYDDNCPIDVYYDALLEYAGKCSKIVNKERKKVKETKSDKTVDVKAIISKNVGSYFAKAGAEICTSENLRMWNEERHYHLNLIEGDQIIGNVMLYFEPQRDYMIVRGFNPRKDTMQKYDKTSMAGEIVRVTEDIARQNDYKEIFIPGQDGWHALSNRDSMAKAVKHISKRNIKQADPKQRTYINNAKFYVEELGGTSKDRLNLLSVLD